jgi:hypothetical protein
MENDANLICKIVATAVAASSEAAKQLKNANDASKDTVESKSLKIINGFLHKSFPGIKCISKQKVSCFILKIKKIS